MLIFSLLCFVIIVNLVSSTKQHNKYPKQIWGSLPKCTVLLNALFTAKCNDDDNILFTVLFIIALTTGFYLTVRVYFCKSYNYSLAAQSSQHSIQNIRKIKSIKNLKTWQINVAENQYVRYALYMFIFIWPHPSNETTS